jgi:hypothetical protein
VEGKAPRILHLIAKQSKSCNISVGIALDYGLDDRGSRARFLARDGNFFLHHRVQNGSAAHPASYAMGRGTLSLGVKRPCVKLTTHLHLVPRSKNEWSYTSTPPIRLHGVMLSLKAQGQFDLLLGKVVSDQIQSSASLILKMV